MFLIENQEFAEKVQTALSDNFREIVAIEIVGAGVRNFDIGDRLTFPRQKFIVDATQRPVVVNPNLSPSVTFKASADIVDRMLTGADMTSDMSGNGLTIEGELESGLKFLSALRR